MEYDVFISCKSEDYALGEPIYHFLNDHGIRTFLSSQELRKLSDAEYLNKISEALEYSYHLIVVGSSPENVESKWVKFEWTTFLNEILSGRKQGQIVTILSGMITEQLPIQIRHYESFNFENYQNSLLNYMETPASLKRREVEEDKQKISILRRKQELDILAEDYSRKINAIQTIEGKKLVEKLKSAGIHEKECPICSEKMDVAVLYCPNCGWPMSPLDGLSDYSYLSYSARQISTVKQYHPTFTPPSEKHELHKAENLSTNTHEVFTPKEDAAIKGVNKVERFIDDICNHAKQFAEKNCAFVMKGWNTFLYKISLFYTLIFFAGLIAFILYFVNSLPYFPILVLLPTIISLLGLFLLRQKNKIGIALLYYNAFVVGVTTFISEGRVLAFLFVCLYLFVTNILCSLYAVAHYRPLSARKICELIQRTHWKTYIVTSIVVLVLSYIVPFIYAATCGLNTTYYNQTDCDDFFRHKVKFHISENFYSAAEIADFYSNQSSNFLTKDYRKAYAWYKEAGYDFAAQECLEYLEAEKKGYYSDPKYGRCGINPATGKLVRINVRDHEGEAIFDTLYSHSIYYVDIVDGATSQQDSILIEGATLDPSTGIINDIRSNKVTITYTINESIISQRSFDIVAKENISTPIENEDSSRSI
ncbi:MAG: TIR domain-containing protein [Alloprevotella sp.]